MEEKKNDPVTAEQENTPNESGYKPRPTWQIWLARIAFLAMSAFVVFQVLNMLFGWGA